MDRKELVEGNIKGAIGKANMPIGRMILLGIFAGMFIACGASASSVAMHAISNVGLARLVAGVIFPVGLMMIVLIGGELFTGDCLMVMGAIDKKYSWLKVIKVWVVVYICNLIGSVIVAVLVYFSGQLNYTEGLLGAYTIKVALGKVNLDFGTAFTSGIMCNIFVCGAVLMAASVKETGGKIWAMFFPIMAFVVSGYEHCVANMYYIPAGIIAMNNEKYVDVAMNTYGYTAEQLDKLNITNYLINNAIPVTIGNIIGGAVFVGVILYFSVRFGEKKTD